MKFRLLLLLCLFVILTACQQTNMQLTDEQRQEIADEIRQTNEESYNIMRDLNEDSFNKWMTYWAESNDEVWVDNPAMLTNNTGIITTKENIDKTWRPTVETRSANIYDIKDDYVAVFSANSAIHIHKGNWTVINKDGVTRSEGIYTGTTVWVKRNNEWKVLHFHQSWNKNQEE